MRIEAIEVDRFGVLEGLDLRDLPGGLNLVVGPNEAGKSSLLAFVVRMLFGFPDARARDERRFGQDEAGREFGGRLVARTRAGEALVLERHPKAARTRRFRAELEGRAVSESELARLVGTGREVFQAVFAVDLGRLVDLSREAAVEEVFAAGLAVGRSPVALEAELAAEAGDLFLARGRKQKLHELRRRLDEVVSDLADLSGRDREWSEAQAEAIELERQAGRLAEAVEAERRARDHAARMVELVEPWAEWTAARSEAERRVAEGALAGAAAEGLAGLVGELPGWREREGEVARLRGEAEAGRQELAAVLAGSRWGREAMGAGEPGPEAPQRLEAAAARIAEAELAAERAEERAQGVRAQLRSERQAEDALAAGVAGSWTGSLDPGAIRVRVETLRRLERAEAALAGVEAELERESSFRAALEAERHEVVARAAEEWAPVSPWVDVGLLAAFGGSAVAATLLMGGMAGAGVALAAALGLSARAAQRESGRRRRGLEREAERLAAELAEVSRKVATTAPRRAELQKEVSESLRALGPFEVTGAGVDRAEELSRAETVLDAALRLAERSRRRIELEAALAEAVAECGRAEARVEAREAEWQELVRDLGLPPEVRPASASDAMWRQREVARLESESRRIEVRLGILEAELAGLRTRATGLIGDEEPVGPGRIAELARISGEAEAATRRAEAALERIRRRVGAALPEVLAELERADGMALEEAVAAADRRIEKLESERDACLEALGKARARRDELAGDGGRASLLAEREAITARVRQEASRWAVLRLAGALSERVRRRFERERQPEVVKESARLFATMTGGRYPDLHWDPFARELSVEDDAGGRVDPRDLSRGTVELLYLAHRLGLVRELARSRSLVLPVLLDDLAVNFDPTRTAALARALSDLAATHQVVFFTCHPWVEAVFAENVPGLNRIPLAAGELRSGGVAAPGAQPIVPQG